ncbi:MAG: Crp/Fnr family transcriptional regulator [Rhodocyclales bacterium]|nr:Crp/Fnr family transcriptional regulator [Rhodocyclales bacterium]
MSLNKRIPDVARTAIFPAAASFTAHLGDTAANSVLSNHLLADLPRKDQERLIRRCERVELQFAQTLHRSGEAIEHVYFPLDSLVSLVTSVDRGAHLEVGLVGSEGVIGTAVALGVATSPWHAVVQGSGAALRMPIAAFSEALADNSTLQRSLNRYLCVLLSQLSRNAACTRFHLIESRLARWLLMTQDRAQTDEFHLTHEFLAFMLGVRRVGITRAAGTLQSKALISYRRGNIRILDRSGLQTAACSCYLANKQAYAHIFARPPYAS